MSDNKILYKIRSLEKMVLRKCIFLDDDCFSKNAQAITQVQIIEYLLEHKNEDVYQCDLESVLNLKRATVSGVLKTMEKNNLIKRVVSSKDTRSKRLILNSELENKLAKNVYKVKSLESAITDGISSHDMNIFYSTLNKMIDNINKI